MKKILLLLLIGAILISCECPYEEYKKKGFYNGQDVFYAEKLLGTWQCYYPMSVANYEIKSMKFVTSNKVDIVVAKFNSVDWYQYTYNYTYYGDYIKFSSQYADYNIRNFTFRIVGYLYPELILQDSFGKYKMAKRKSNGC